MGSCYHRDLYGLEMFSEIMDCRMLLKTRADEKLEKSENLLCFIRQSKSKSWFSDFTYSCNIQCQLSTVLQ